METIPVEILLHISHFIGINEIYILSQTSKSLYITLKSNSDSVHHAIIHHDVHPIIRMSYYTRMPLFFTELAPNSIMSGRQIYKKLVKIHKSVISTSFLVDDYVLDRRRHFHREHNLGTSSNGRLHDSLAYGNEIDSLEKCKLESDGVLAVALLWMILKRAQAASDKNLVQVSITEFGSLVYGVFHNKVMLN